MYIQSIFIHISFFFFFVLIFYKFSNKLPDFLEFGKNLNYGNVKVFVLYLRFKDRILPFLFFAITIIFLTRSSIFFYKYVCLNPTQQIS